MKKLRVTVDGKSYDVSVEILEGGSPAAAAPAPAPASVGSASVSAPAGGAPKPKPAPSSDGGSGDVTSPLAGKIVSIDTAVGKQVSEGDEILTLEAMKMNTYLYASKTGTVKAIHANVGDAVEEGQVLISIE